MYPGFEDDTDEFFIELFKKSIDKLKGKVLEVRCREFPDNYVEHITTGYICILYND